MNTWISVNDSRKPELGEKVLVVQNPETTATRKPLFAIWTGKVFMPEHPTYFADFEIAKSLWSDIVYWMSLPLTPAELAESPQEIDAKVQRMAELMQFKLDKNKHKECSTMNPDGKGRGWCNCDVRWLLMRLREEADEIEKELDDYKSPDRVAKECADVCNFAMMIADNVGGLDVKEFEA